MFAAADAQTQAIAGQRLHGLHAMRQFDRVAQRNLQHGNPQFHPPGDGGENGEFDERIKRWTAATQ